MRLGRPVEIITPGMHERIYRIVMKDRQMKVRKIVQIVSVLVARVHTILHEKLQMKKLCVRWVSFKDWLIGVLFDGTKNLNIWYFITRHQNHVAGFVSLPICFFICLYLFRCFVTSTTRVPLFSFPIRENTLTQHNIPAYELGTLFPDFIWKEFLEAGLSLEIIQFHNIILLILLNYSNFKNQLCLQLRYSIFPPSVSSSVFLILLIRILLSM